MSQTASSECRGVAAGDPPAAVDDPLGSAAAGRYRRAALTAASLGGGRSVALLSSLIFAPFVFRYLGAAQFGIWVTLTAAIGIIGFSDLGIANGLVSAIANAHGHDDPETIRRSIATALAMLCSIAAVLGAIFLAVYWLVPWPSLLNVGRTVSGSEVDAAVAATAACFLIGLPFVIAEKTELGVQRGYIAGGWVAAGNVLGLTVALIGILVHAGLALFVAATLGGPVVAGACNCATWFGGRFRDFRPRLGYADRETAKSLLRVGALFLALNLTFAVAFASDPIVVNQVLGPKAAAQFWLPMRLFGIVPVACSLFLAAMWPAYGEAFARKDHDWVVRTLRRTFAGGLVCAIPIGLVLAFAGRWILHVWVGPKAHPSATLMLAIGLWAVFWILGSIVSTFLTGARVMRLQAVCAIVMAAFNLPLSILWAHTIGSSGVVWASLVTYSLFVVIPYAVAVPRIVTRLR